MRSAALALAKHAASVQTYGVEFGVDPECLFGILVLEHINRGGVGRSLERVLARVSPGYLISRDSSLGLAQVKVSTAAMVLSLSKSEVIPHLMRDDTNIRTCAALLRHLFVAHSLCSVPQPTALWHLAKLYLTGRLDGPDYPWVKLYARLLRHSVATGLLARTLTATATARSSVATT